jgi:hypothetical protein
MYVFPQILIPHFSYYIKQRKIQSVHECCLTDKFGVYALLFGCMWEVLGDAVRILHICLTLCAGVFMSKVALQAFLFV